MDAKSKANFINAVAVGTSTVCPKCGKEVKPNSLFCTFCGTNLSANEAAPKTAPAFEPVKEQTAPAFEQIQNPAAENNAPLYQEPVCVFAEGLPEWSLEPPQVMVRRR